MSKKKHKEKEPDFQIGDFLSSFNRAFGRKSIFSRQVTQTKIEFLKAIRSLVDDKIENLEKKRSGKTGKKMEKIKIE